MIRAHLVRGVYRLQQAVGMTPLEFKAATLFVALLFAGTLARRWYDRPAPIDASAYADLEAAFFAQADRIAARDTIEARRDSTAGPDSTAHEESGDRADAGVLPLASRTPEPIDLNSAGADALVSLPRIGPAIAGRILEFRARHGPFRFVDDLLLVRGIGEKTLESLRPLVTVRAPDDTVRAPRR